MRTRHLIVGLLVLGLAVLAHWFYWYRPSERPGAPDAVTIPGRVFVDSELSYRVWLPYPHQNLAELEGALGDMEELLSSLARLSSRPTPEMPAFGAASVPPSSELVLAADESGERFVAVAQVYPIPALLARWAGKLAGNPLLAGGRSEIDGRPVEASWRGNTWIVATPGAMLAESAMTPEGAVGPGSERRSSDEVTALAWVEMAEAQGRIPGGQYRLQREGGDLLLTGGDEATVARLRELGQASAPMPLITAQSFATRGPLEARFLALVPGVESIAGLPGAVTAFRGSRRWHAPGARIMSLVGDGAPTIDVEGWKIEALDRQSLETGRGLVDLSRRLEGMPALGVAVWVELRAAGELIDQVIEALEAVPVIGRREARRWRSAASVLSRFDEYERLTAFVVARPAAVVVRLERRNRSTN